MNCSASPGLSLLTGQLALFVIIEKWNMRELQIIQSIFDQVLRKVQEREEKRAIHLHLALDELSELDPPSIQRHWQKISNGTRAEHGELHVRLISAEVQCMACFQKYRSVDKKISCPYCPSRQFRRKNPDWRGVLP